ncbi:MAG: kelch repeat-containing protein [Cyanobacteria bacterium P01_D01_bin.50]
MTSVAKLFTDMSLPDGWKTGAKLPLARLESSGTVANGKLYVFGGFVVGLLATSRVDVYDPQSDSWRQLADMPEPVTHVNAVVEGKNIWFAGGFVGDHPAPVTRQVWKYDTVADSWSGGIPLPLERGGGAMQLVGRSLHYFGGFASDRDTTCGDHWVLSLDGGTEWIPRAPLPDAKGHLASILLGDKIYAIGGQYRHDTKPKDVASVHVYDPTQDRWSELASLPEPRSHFEPGTFVFNDQIIIIGGRNNRKKRENNPNFWNHKEDRYIDDLPHRVWRKVNHHWNYDYISCAIAVYDPLNDTWTELSTLPAHLLAPVANAIKNQLIVTGGGKNWVTNPQCRTLLNQTLLDAVKRPKSHQYSQTTV